MKDFDNENGHHDRRQRSPSLSIAGCGLAPCASITPRTRSSGAADKAGDAIKGGADKATG